ncbi:ATPase [uncultured Microbacterium sp.]|uniref:ATPase n=2 Tax=uncultured Microbacterium sp. TaxID=191216 RepID=A0A1Y5P8T7_9MICO|nr:ATPase [uncultured Microbacterium sp.]
MEPMKNALWFLLGITGGFVAAHLVNKDPRGHEVLAEVDARISEFTERIGDAYRAQEAKIEGLVADAKDAASHVVDAAQKAASAAADDVADAAAEAVEASKDAAAKLTD